jgi:hypothetical protein
VRFFRLAAFALLSVGLSAEVSFNRDIRPIMSDTCFRCHGPDKGSRMAGLRLDLRDEATKTRRNGSTPIVPGDPEKSSILQRMFSDNPKKVMPPPYAHKELSEHQKQTIKTWIAEGAKYEGHWAYQPVRRPELPVEFRQKNAVDAFIQDRLRRENLNASPEADRRTLIRRVFLDLTGLPPKPADVEAFLKDTTPYAFERLVDRLLASPAFAEKQAMHWLDAVRYADTAGFHGDNPIPAWPYRDYVLRAFHDNKPFDQFTVEQLAGDLIPNATTEQKVGSAFNRINRVSAEGGLQQKEYLAKYAADRVRTVSAVWLGTTTGCAECHDHKFDPILAKDFYAMKAFFADVKENGLVSDRGPEAWGSQIALYETGQQEKLLQLTETAKAKRKSLEDKYAALGDLKPWVNTILERAKRNELGWKWQRPLTTKAASGATLKVYNAEMLDSSFEVFGSVASYTEPGNGTVVAQGPVPDNDTYSVTFKPGVGKWAQFALELVYDDTLPALRLARGSDRLLITELELEEVSGATSRRLPVSLAFTTFPYPNAAFPISTIIDGNPNTGWAPLVYGPEVQKPMIALRFAQPVESKANSVYRVTVRHDSAYRKAVLGRFRLALSEQRETWPEGIVKLKESMKPRPAGLGWGMAGGLESGNANSIRDYAFFAHPELEEAYRDWQTAEAERGMFDATIPKVLVSQAVAPRETRILGRGNWMDETGQIVEPAVPEFLGKLNQDGRASRLDFARWLVNPQNPLTARVQVNRVWKQFFGVGLSKQLEDFGSQGEWPTHPELLDWLAAEFMQPSAANKGAWDYKHLVKTIVTSHTYRQSSLPKPGDEKDPENRLLARQSRFRVDAEVVRDIALSVSGLMKDRFGGPSVRPYQPNGYLAALNFPKREYPLDRGDDLYRRGVYTHWQRTFLHPSLLAFDAPTREECTVARTYSNTPLQALVLLNDPIYVEAARGLAQTVLQLPIRETARITEAFQQTLGRAPSTEELKILNALYQQSLTQFRLRPQQASQLLSMGELARPKSLPVAQLAAMTNVTRAILNMHETITRN